MHKKIITKKARQFVIDAYVNNKKSIRWIKDESLKFSGQKLDTHHVKDILKQCGVCQRNLSESVSLASCRLDQTKSFLNDVLMEWIDGFLLGDGSISFSKNALKMPNARFSFGSTQEQWTKYAMSGLYAYQPGEPRQYGKAREKAPNIAWQNRTLTHPDIESQMHRWHPNRGRKIVPKDVRITPTSVMLWYLGDGSIRHVKHLNTINIDLATCAFSVEEIENILLPKLAMHGIVGKRTSTKYHSIYIGANYVKRFFDFIGWKCPISCYDYKFDVPPWIRLNNLKHAFLDKNDRWRAIYYIRSGRIEHTRSPGGKFILLTDNQLAKMRKLLYQQ